MRVATITRTTKETNVAVTHGDPDFVTNAPSADQSQDRSGTHTTFERVKGIRDQRGKRLREHSPQKDLKAAGSSGLQRFERLHIASIEDIREHLPDETAICHGQCQCAGERPQPDHCDEQDRPEDVGHRSNETENRACKPARQNSCACTR